MLEVFEQQTQPKPPAASSVQAAPKKGISWKKIIVSVVAILVVAGAIAGALYWYFVINEEETTTTETTKVSTPSSKQATPSAKKDETADWKVYTNTTGKYTLKYPVNYEKFAWTKAQLDPYTHEHSFQSPDYKPPTMGPTVNVTSGKGSTFWVDVCMKGSQCTILKNEPVAKERAKYITNTVDYTVDQVEGKRFNYVNSHGEKQIRIELEWDDRFYSIVLDYGRHELNQQQLEIFNLMLSTFKFLD
jgi:hypothetical protein